MKIKNCSSFVEAMDILEIYNGMSKEELVKQLLRSDIVIEAQRNSLSQAPIPAFCCEETVYLKTDTEKLPRIVTAFKVTSKDITYELCCGTVVSWHYDFEISRDRETGEKREVGLGAR